MEKKKVLLLVGSPAKSKSTSNSIGEYILDNLDENVYDREIMHLYSVHNSEEKLNLLLARINDVDLLIISAPLYVDTTPAVVIRVLQAIHKFRMENKPTKEQRMLAISNSGFPEYIHNVNHISVYENFAKQAGFTWLGGIPFGMGGIISGKSLVNVKGMVKKLVKGLDILVSRIDEPNPVNEDVLKLVTKKSIPNWLYRFVANMNWNKVLKKNKVKKHVYDKPFA